MMKYWLVMFVLVEGSWVAGAKMPTPGWSPRAYDSLEICRKRRDFAAKLVKQTGRAETRHFCTTTPEASLEDLEKAASQ